MSKLSLHISNWLDPDATFDFIGRTKPPMVKVFAEGGLDDVKIREAKKRSPNTLFVGRKYFADQVLEHLDNTFPGDSLANYDPVGDAQNVFFDMQDVLAKYDGVVDIWEGLNEIPIDTDEPLTERNRRKARAYNDFTVALANLMHQAGQKFAAYSFSTGNPVHVELWDLLLDGLGASDYLALHEYILPDAAWQQFNTSMMIRYRQVYARLPADARRPVMITECGDDYFGRGGYRGTISNDLYLSHLKAYDAALMQDPYVIGAAIYCYGISGPQWKTYDIGGAFTQMLAAYIAATPTPVQPTIPVVVAPPPPTTPPSTVTPPSGGPPPGTGGIGKGPGGGATPGTPTVYTVQRGDTLSGIARKFNTTVAALVAANQIANPSLIRVGQKLIIPGSTT